MNTALMRERLHGYLETADEKKVKAIYTMVEEDINRQLDYVLSEDQITFLNEEDRRYVAGESKLYSWEETKKIILNKTRK